MNASESIFGRILKRGLDILAGLAVCLLLVPLSMFVKHKNKQNGDQDPVFFTQERIGKDGKPILIYKYRAMVPHAEEILEELKRINQLPDGQVHSGKYLTIVYLPE